ncbi:hypothetical protein RJ55_04298 [Drechmeria coniospora]|nr:hypothetical protein RJ55_04298 [Drechmeria coniospora]
MQYLTYLSLASGAMAGLIPAVHLGEPAKRDVNTVKTVMTNVAGQMNEIDHALQNLDTDVSGVIAASKKLNKMLQDGTAEISKSGMLDAGAPYDLSGTAASFLATGHQLQADMIRSRPKIAAANACDDVRDNLDDIADNTHLLLQAALSKFPNGLLPIIDPVMDLLEEIVIEAQETYADAKCVNKDGSGRAQAGVKSNSVQKRSVELERRDFLTSLMTMAAPLVPMFTKFMSALSPAKTTIKRDLERRSFMDIIMPMASSLLSMAGKSSATTTTTTAAKAPAAGSSSLGGMSSLLSGFTSLLGGLGKSS